jgi:hypothetical protein
MLRNLRQICLTIIGALPPARLFTKMFILTPWLIPALIRLAVSATISGWNIHQSYTFVASSILMLLSIKNGNPVLRK